MVWLRLPFCRPQHLFSKKEVVPWMTPPHVKGYPQVALWEISLSIDVIDPLDIQLQQKLSRHDGIIPYNHCTLIKIRRRPVPL